MNEAHNWELIQSDPEVSLWTPSMKTWRCSKCFMTVIVSHHSPLERRFRAKRMPCEEMFLRFVAKHVMES